MATERRGRDMHVLILQFEPDDPPGRLGTRLTWHGAAWDAVPMDATHEPPSLDGYDALVALGGAMNANESARYPFLDEAQDLLRDAVGRRLPCLGICLGGQLMARALGAPVRRNHTQEVGRIQVTLEPGAHLDPLLRELGPVVETVQFHEDTFDLPPGATLLASSAATTTQIVRCAERAYAVQFHPEAAWHNFADWVEQGYAGFAGAEAAAQGPALVEEVRAHDAAIHAHADILFDNFVRLAAPAR